jgi:coenzyme F420 hydrogenase subunit beta
MIYALENDIIDGAIVAGMDKECPWRMVPRIATNREEVMASGQTKLAMISTDSMLGEALDRGYRRLGIVGCPCHVHAIRKMQQLNRPRKIVNSIKFVLGLVCGNNCSYTGTEHMIEEVVGVPLDQVAGVWYRKGEYPGEFTVLTKDGLSFSRSRADYVSHITLFKRDRCLMCHDYSAELADVSVGNYFGPKMKGDVPGLSASIVRTDVGMKLMEKARQANYIAVTGPCEKANFYNGGFETKKHGGSYYLNARRKRGQPTPENQLPLLLAPMRR